MELIYKQWTANKKPKKATLYFDISVYFCTSGLGTSLSKFLNKFKIIRNSVTIYSENNKRFAY